MSDYSMSIPDIRFEQIPIKDLMSIQNCQQNLLQNYVNRPTISFNPLLVSPTKVVRRNGVNFVFSGQLTIEIIALVSGSRDTLVWCMIFDDPNYEVEADIIANHSLRDKYYTSNDTVQNKVLALLAAMKEEF